MSQSIIRRRRGARRLRSRAAWASTLMAPFALGLLVAFVERVRGAQAASPATVSRQRRAT